MNLLQINAGELVRQLVARAQGVAEAGDENVVNLTPFKFARTLPVMATTAHLRRMNQRRVVETMARLGRASRVELARAAGISQPTVSRIVDELLSQGLLMEASEQPAGATETVVAVGRPSTPLQLDDSRPRFAVIQVGVRKTRLFGIAYRDPHRGSLGLRIRFAQYARSMVQTAHRCMGATSHARARSGCRQHARRRG